MLQLLLAIISAHAQSVTFSGHVAAVTIGDGTIKHNGNPYGNRYAYINTGETIGGSIEVGNESVGFHVMTMSNIFSDNEHGRLGITIGTVGIIGHKDDLSIYAGVGIPIGYTQNKMESDTSQSVRIGGNRRIITGDNGSVKIGIDATHSSYGYPFDFSVVHRTASLVLTISSASAE